MVAIVKLKKYVPNTDIFSIIIYKLSDSHTFCLIILRKG